MSEQFLDRVPMQAGDWYKPGFLDRVLEKVGPKGIYSIQDLVEEAKSQFRPLISGADQTKLAVGIDTSHWTGKLTHGVVAGADVIFPKCTDGHQVRAGDFYNKKNYIDSEFYNTVQTAYEVGRPVIPFHYFQWKYDNWNLDHTAKFQYEIIKEAFKPLVKGKSYHGIALDLEEPGDTGTNMATRVQLLYNLLHDDPQFSGLPILFYSSNYYLNMWPPLRDWLSYPGANKLLWLAQWSWTQRWTGTWERFYQEVLPKINMRVITPGYANWTVVQWSASITIDGFNLDLNSWNRSREDLYKFLNFTPAATNPEEPGDPNPGDGDDGPIDPDFLKRLETVENRIKDLESKFKNHVHPSGPPSV